MKTLSQVNYTPLYEMKGMWRRALQMAFPVPIPIVFSIAILLLILSPVIPFGMVFVALGMILFGKKYAEERSRIWRKFAEVNGWKVTLASVADMGIVPPGIANEGHSRKLGDIIHAEFDRHACDIFTYQFTVGAGKSSQTWYYTIARVELSRPFPHIILDSKNSWTIRSRGSATQRVSLEGDFDKYFSLYHDRNEHIDALSIVTPDVMKVLITTNRNEDIEIIGNNLYFMTSGDKTVVNSLPQLLGSVNALADEIAHRARTLRYEPTSGQSSVTATASSLFGL